MYTVMKNNLNLILCHHVTLKLRSRSPKLSHLEKKIKYSCFRSDPDIHMFFTRIHPLAPKVERRSSKFTASIMFKTDISREDVLQK